MTKNHPDAIYLIQPKHDPATFYKTLQCLRPGANLIINNLDVKKMLDQATI
ncbi:hypothetical protein DPMN_086678 [Dreissena polymorpha]|uniref:Uncharacterized protein n=1 Tax=Dreissena polymorpha TaxID=45954 RepID=A0A9D4KRG2_DREPO|nr:hypothetical protein DPMN_086678 [Dreissena polymorpha]